LSVRFGEAGVLRRDRSRRGHRRRHEDRACPTSHRPARGSSAWSTGRGTRSRMPPSPASSPTGCLRSPPSLRRPGRRVGARPTSPDRGLVLGSTAPGWFRSTRFGGGESSALGQNTGSGRASGAQVGKWLTEWGKWHRVGLNGAQGSPEHRDRSRNAPVGNVRSGK
jgi:hypothetical protein